MDKKTLNLIKECVKKHYSDNLVSLCIFGSVARKEDTESSDIDLLVICKKLKRGRLSRIKEFEKVENCLKKKGTALDISPVIKTTEEVKLGSPLFWDMTEHCIFLYDRDNFFKNYLRDLKKRLDSLGAKKIKKGSIWIWVLKDKFSPGEVFSI